MINGQAVAREELIGDVELDKLLSEFSNAIFDCGDWDDDDEQPYGELLKCATDARIALATAIRKRLANI